MSEPFPTPDTDNILMPDWFQPFNPLYCDETRATEGYRRKLPHWRYHGATYFLTFRLHDSLPRAVAKALHGEAAEWEKHVAAERSAMNGQLSATTRKACEDFQREHFRILESHLDACHGCCLLRVAAHRIIMHEALLHFQNERCRMAAFVIMPNTSTHFVMRCPVGRWRTSPVHGKSTPRTRSTLARYEGVASGSPRPTIASSATATTSAAPCVTSGAIRKEPGLLETMRRCG